MSVGLSMVKECKKGAVIIGCEDKQSFDKLKVSIVDGLGLDYKIEESKLKLPKFKLFNVEVEDADDGDVNKEDSLINKIFKQNDISIHENFEAKIVFKNLCANKREFNIIVQADPIFHSEILKKGKINVGWKRCRVENHINVTRCFKCSRFGHYAKDCTSATEVCPHCMKNHRINECTSATSEYKCVNCKYVAENLKLNVKYDHAALDKECPSYLKIFKNLERQIDYSIA